MAVAVGLRGIEESTELSTNLNPSTTQMKKKPRKNK